ncbi:hypothetical protein PTH_1981 [Pelotomaculum thermopropionicum SI]|uniref:Uncharacterized protein n=1 Tax=Pelotomaculum thermopropionicum (strain DSM 13744 / JCM 10971 / SI) TaxID=370438 RepID=A5D0Q5_PELTS|nr:hypothetical protein PTH_1981 [Pelotomaculum thermopropionicum SI]
MMLLKFRQTSIKTRSRKIRRLNLFLLALLRKVRTKLNNSAAWLIMLYAARPVEMLVKKIGPVAVHLPGRLGRIAAVVDNPAGVFELFLLRQLGGNAQPGLGRGKPVPFGQPLNLPFFFYLYHPYFVYAVVQPYLNQKRGFNYQYASLRAAIGFNFFYFTANGFFYSRVGNFVQPGSGLRVGKDNGSHFFAVKLALGV